MKEYEIWAEGCCDQGMEGIPQKAQLMGKAYGNSFAEACRNWFIANVSKEEFDRYFFISSDGTPTYYTRLFDNEVDARKIFG